MAEYRTHMRIIGDILYTARDDHQDGGGAGVTHLIRKANVPHAKISGILKTLVSQGLLEKAGGPGASRYRISPSGREFLQAYQTFTRFADSFGLAI